MPGSVNSAVIDHSSSVKLNYRILFSFRLSLVRRRAGSAEEAGKWDTSYDAFRPWHKAGTWERLLDSKNIMSNANII